MERFLCWRTMTHVLLAVLMLGFSVPAALAQKLTDLYIDCGATSSYADSATNVFWEADAPYISSGKTQTLTLPSSLQSFTEMRTLRYFDDDARAKNCYAVPVVHNNSYLLRLTFFYGNYDNANLPPSFQVAIDANIVSNVTVDATTFSYREYHYKTRGNVTFVCLLRTSPGDRPFISGISLRVANGLADDAAPRYSAILQQGIIMSILNRVNFGGSALIRAPADFYDRFWFPEGPTSIYYMTPQIADHKFLSTSTSIIPGQYWPPSPVLQTAVTSSGRIRSYMLPEGYPVVRSQFHFTLYFAELNSSFYTPVRNFSMYMPAINSWGYNLDLSSLDYLDFARARFTYPIPNMPGVTNPLDTNTVMILEPLPSDEGGPILNAMEIFTRSEERVAKTHSRDALAIEDIKKSYNLTEWTGDPCLPVPHAWITCTIISNETLPVITAVNLSGYHLVGTLQAVFSNLLNLTSLDLSNNALSGPLPEWLTTMPALRLLAVQNNNFSGAIPSGLLSADSQIQFTYEGNAFWGDPPGPASAITKCSNCGKSNTAIIAGASAAGGVVILALISGVAILLCRRRRKPRNPKLSADEGDKTPANIVTSTGGAKAYTFAEVVAATAQFTREVGRGGFGPVYYGTLPGGQEVAVKVADENSKHEETAFFTEVDALSQVHHKHLVALVGYCQEQQQQILIYEYMHNGSLFDHLHGNAVSTGILDWRMRLNIALNTAQGLEYLHTTCRPSFIHGDVKSSNILLTPQFEAKVADFGVTKLMQEANGIRVMTVVGTTGYLDPEYYTSHSISSKSDVYSFGIVLLELITGCLPIDSSPPNGRNSNIGNWVRDSLHNNDITSILDPAVKTSNPNMEAVWKVVDVAMQSVEPRGVHRPTITEVVQELQGALSLEIRNMRSTQAPVWHLPQPSGISDYSSDSYGPNWHIHQESQTTLSRMDPR